MRTILFTFAVLAFVIKVSAAGTNAASPFKIGAADATNHYDQEMIVTGKIAQVTIRPTVTFLNLDKNHPDSPFQVVIFHGKSSFNGDANALKGKSIEIQGKIENYQDKPEIVLDSTNQLTVFDSKGVNITATILQSTNHPQAKTRSTNAAPVLPPATLTNFPEIM